MNLQPFDNGDWMAYSGAEGDNPKIDYDNPVVLDGTKYEAVFVCDTNGLHIDLFGIVPGQDDNPYMKTIQYDTDQRTAEFMANSMRWEAMTRDGLEAMGFYFTD